MKLEMCRVNSVVKALKAADSIDLKALPIYEAIGEDFSIMDKKISTLEEKFDKAQEDNKKNFGELNGKLDLLITQGKHNSEEKQKRLSCFKETAHKIIDKPFFWFIITLLIMYANGDTVASLKGIISGLGQ